jgi:1-acyl-sn-glycerol-3-phosphate acyltransferase
MPSVVIAKPYTFVPPDRRSFWPAVFRPLLRPILAQVWGVTTVEFVGIERLKLALRERAGVLLAPNHCRPCDPMVIGVLAAEAGTPLYLMASWHQFTGGRSKAWLLRRLGAFSVYREGLDRVAVRTAIELLLEARRPLAVFPEGIITRSNDRLGALYEGPAFIAYSAAKQRAKNEPGARTLIIPVALRYHFLGRLQESAAPVLDRIETRLTWKPRPDLPLIERLRRAGNAILGLKELELVGEFRHATLAERLPRLINEILGPLEAEWKVKIGESYVPARVRALRKAILPELVDGGISDLERDRRWEQIARLDLAQRLSLYPAGYLDGYPSKERVLETVERLEEDLTDLATVHRPLAVTVSVGEPLAVVADGPRPSELTNHIRDRIETMLNIRNESDRAAETGHAS